MERAIHLEPKQVPAALRCGYAGTKFKAVVCESVTIPSDAGLWSGGSRDHYSLINITNGRAISMPGQSSAPWDGSRREHQITLPENGAVVLHSTFCGKDMGLTFYVRPDNAAQLLPAPSETLTRVEQLVINATCAYKSNYGGKDRYMMARDDWRYKNDGAEFPDRNTWDDAKAALVRLGYLNKAGAITVKGRNARTDR